ncbi:MAG: type II toxin-antitoxin system VapC family toxin [Caulobacteraceae bacterium]
MRFVVDASVALKWVIEEAGSPQAVALRSAEQLLAPDLILAECVNALWKKVRRAEIDPETCHQAARLLAQAPVEIRPTRDLVTLAMEMTFILDHPAYDCFYLALAFSEGCALVSADERFRLKANAKKALGIAETLTLKEAVETLAP